MRYRVETFPNPHALAFHLRRRLTNSYYSSEVMREETPPRLRSLMESLIRIRGVKSVTVGCYELSVRKTELFNWKSIKPRVIAVLKKHFSPKEAMKAI